MFKIAWAKNKLVDGCNILELLLKKVINTHHHNYLSGNQEWIDSHDHDKNKERLIFRITANIYLLRYTRRINFQYNGDSVSIK